MLSPPHRPTQSFACPNVTPTFPRCSRQVVIVVDFLVIFLFLAPVVLKIEGVSRNWNLFPRLLSNYFAAAFLSLTFGFFGLAHLPVSTTVLALVGDGLHAGFVGVCEAPPTLEGWPYLFLLNVWALPDTVFWVPAWDRVEAAPP